MVIHPVSALYQHGGNAHPHIRTLARTYTHTHTHAHAHVHKQIWSDICVCTHAHAQTRAYTHVAVKYFLYICLHTRTNTHTHLYARTHTYTYTNTHTHTLTLTHTRTHARARAHTHTHTPLRNLFADICLQYNHTMETHDSVLISSSMIDFIQPINVATLVTSRALSSDLGLTVCLTYHKHEALTTATQRLRVHVGS